MSSRASRFKNVFAAARAEETQTEPPTEGRAPTAPSRSRRAVEPPAEPRRRGRPRAKRSDPDFGQITAYIRKRTHRDVKLALLQDGEGKEFSELVEELLNSWLKRRPRSD
jgi:hypothetical protein